MAIISFAFRVKDNHAAVCLHNIWFYKKSCLARTAAADHQDVEIASVPMSIKSDSYALCQYLVHAGRMLSVLFVHGSGIAPFSRTVLLATPVVAACGLPDPDAHGIYKETK